MKCARCQTDNPEGNKFCRQCGVSLSPTCPHCGAFVHPDDTFCGQCGRKTPEVPPKEGSVAEAQGERKYATILFSDLSGYTALSEKLDPEELKEMTGRLFGELAKVVGRYGGFVEMYIGDAAMGVFGVPFAHEDDPLRAIRAARDIHELVSQSDVAGYPLSVHTGINTGLIVTGKADTGKGTHSIAGDTINLASRLSDIAKPNEILVGENTYLRSKGVFSFEKLEPVSVKGKVRLVVPYRLLEEKAEPARGPAFGEISSPLVGRTAEIAALQGCVNWVLDGHGALVSVIGDAGLGKSRLMAELRRTYENDVLWLEGRALSYGQKMSYWPFREVLWHYAGITEDDTDAEAWEKLGAKLVELFSADSVEVLPYLAGLIGIENKGDPTSSLRHLDGESMGKLIYLSSRRFFERLALTRPLVLVFEDLQWADESTVALIEHLFPLINRVPLLICAVSRFEQSYAARLRDVALRDYERRYTEIRLNPLSPSDCTKLVGNLLLVDNLSGRVRQVIAAKADGNPFFVEEIVRTFIDRGAVHYENGLWKATSQIETIGIPDTIKGVIMARIDRLDEEAKHVLCTASVIGRAFPYRVLRAVEGTTDDLDKDVDRLVSAGLIREKQKVPELEYIFKHALVQESTYESILLKRRLDLHGKVASAVEALFSDRHDEFASLLAYHYAKAENWEKAQEYLFKAGDQAGRIAADAEALTYYQQALETYARAFGDQWDPIRRGVLERKMGEAFCRRGEYDQALEYLQRALVYFGRPRLAASRLQKGRGIVREAAAQVGLRIFSGRLSKKKGYGVIDQAFEEVLRVYEVIETINSTRAPDRFLLTALTCLNLCERKGFTPGVAMEYSTLRYIAHLLAFSSGVRFFRKRAMAVAEETRYIPAVIRSYLVATVVECETGEFRQAIAYGLKGAEICRREGYPNLAFWAFIVIYTCLSYYYLGAYQEARRLADELIRTGEDVNDPHAYACGLTILGITDERQGSFEECIGGLKKAIEVSESIPNYELRVTAGYTLARCYLRLGDIDQGLNIAIETGTYRAKHKVRLSTHFVMLTLCRAYLAQAEEAGGGKRADWLRKAKGPCRKALRLARVRRNALPEALRLRGLYDWLSGRRTSAEKLWQQSIVLAQQTGARYDLGMTHLEIGRRLNDIQQLKQAERIFSELGAKWDLEQARRLLQPPIQRKAV